MSIEPNQKIEVNKALNSETIPVDTSQSKPKVQLVKVVLLVVLLLAILACAFYFISNSKNTGIKNTATVVPAAKPKTPVVYSSASEFYGMQSQEKIQFPTVVSTSTIPVTSLPADIKNLLPTDAVGIQVYSVQYSNGKTGFEVSYNSLEALTSLFNNFILQLKGTWNILVGLRSALAAMIQAQNNSYNLQINQSYSGTEPVGNVFTVIQVIKN